MTGCSPGRHATCPARLVPSKLQQCRYTVAALRPTHPCVHTLSPRRPPQDALQSFLLLPAPVALGLLLALWPLAAGTARGPHNPHLHGGGGGGGGGGGRRDLRDYAVMLLRKVMFAREAASRWGG